MNEKENSNIISEETQLDDADDSSANGFFSHKYYVCTFCGKVYGSHEGRAKGYCCGKKLEFHED